MSPLRRSGRTFDPLRDGLAYLAWVGQLGFLVVGGALAGFAVGYGLDALAGGRSGQIAGLLVGLACGLLAAGRHVIREIRKDQGDESR